MPTRRTPETISTTRIDRRNPDDALKNKLTARAESRNGMPRPAE